jgi:hypothetical protein
MNTAAIPIDKNVQSTKLGSNLSIAPINIRQALNNAPVTSLDSSIMLFLS